MGGALLRPVAGVKTGGGFKGLPLREETVNGTMNVAVLPWLGIEVREMEPFIREGEVRWQYDGTFGSSARS